MNQNFTPAELPVSELQLDLNNPRMPDDSFASEEEALEYLVENGALEELVQSITSSGWINYEPLIVLTDDNIVIEGNRRLAALRLIADPDMARGLGVDIPASMHEDAKPEVVNVWLVDDRRDARDFIGFKHINGPFKWDSFAKAKYAAEWLADDQDDLPAVARRLGDTHKTVARLVNGYKVLHQAERLGFDRSNIKGRFAFSHLYTALTRPSYRTYLGLGDAPELLPDGPIDADHRPQLAQLMLWLYGQDETPAVIKSQNPDLKRLAEVLPSRTAVAMLTAERNLDIAHAIVEDRGKLFSDAVFALNAAARSAATLIGNYDGGDEDLEQLVDTTLRTVRGIQASMTARSREDNA